MILKRITYQIIKAKLNHIKWISFLLVFILLGSCIKPFNPDVNAEAINKYVIEGSVSSIEGWQNVKVSIASDVSRAEYVPVNNCELMIIDDLGQNFPLTQYEDGEYRVWMNNSELIPGRSFKINVHLPNGEILESAFDQMPLGPDEVGDVYFEIEDIPTNDPEYTLNGIQMYTDFSADEMDSKFYRWKLTETWEYHSEYPREFYYDATGLHQVVPADYSYMYCWKTVVVNDIYTLSTGNLSENALDKYPLNYIRNNTYRLKILYSLMIEQMALSENAYYYWDKLRVNLSQEAGLYTSQPLAVKGNLTNVNTPEKEVLGFFQANNVSKKRIFIWPIDELELDLPTVCIINGLRFGFIEIPVSEYPAFIYSDNGVWQFATMVDDCVLCPVLGGVTEKPDYWPY